MKIYEVGGCVRDKIIGKEANDIDHVVVGATVDEMMSDGFKQVGKNFPVFLKDGKEYALARKEIKTGPKHHDFKFIFTPDISLQEDLERRDFTCNALAYDKENDKIIDFHNGIADIKNKILRHVNSTHFPEDPLRVLRMCRFSAQLDFEIAPETLNLAKKMVEQGMLSYLSAERIWQEVYKSLETPNFDKFVLSMHECGALNALFPEIEKLFTTPERTDFHPEGNSGIHTILCLKQANCFNAEVKFAVLLHDIGKTQTPIEILPSHHFHEKNGLPIIDKICSQLKVPNKYKNFATLACKNHMKLHLIQQMRLGTLVDFVSLFNDSTLENFISVCYCDFMGRDITIRSDEIDFFQQNAEYMRKVYSVLQNIKATTMPNFEKIIKDSNFKNKFRDFKIRILKDFLSDEI